MRKKEGALGKSNELPSFHVGQSVFVSRENQDEEMGTILKLGCTFSNCEVNDDVLISEERHDGVMVRNQVSRKQQIVPPECLCPLESFVSDISQDSENVKEGIATRARRKQPPRGGATVTDDSCEGRNNSEPPVKRRKLTKKAQTKSPATRSTRSACPVTPTSVASKPKKGVGKGLQEAVALDDDQFGSNNSNNDLEEDKKSDDTEDDKESDVESILLEKVVTNKIAGKKSLGAKSKAKRKSGTTKEELVSFSQEKKPDGIASNNEMNHEHIDLTKTSSETTIVVQMKDEAMIKPIEIRSKAKASMPPKSVRAGPSNDNNNNLPQRNSNDEVDDDSDKDYPFKIDYAPTGRSTCRRCDSNIEQFSARISHCPLFRGKPGFRVFRHLECALFTEDIVRVEQIGGWRKLSQDDLERLALRIEESKLELEEENRDISPDELVPLVFEGETRSPPTGLVAPLLPFQTEGVSWMYHQEVHVPDIRGGVLADEMGMGKTLQTIVTILDNRPLLQHSKSGAKHAASSPDYDRRVLESELWDTAATGWNHEMDMCKVPSNLRPKYATARAGTLVVCPVIALSQWKSEIEKFTAPGTLSIGTYHGPNRSSEMPAEMMQKYDVILTTYQVLEQDFRKMVSPNKVACPNCGGKFKLDKLKIHLKYFCGEGARRTEAQSRQHRTADRRGRNGRETTDGSGKGKGKKNDTPSMKKSFATNKLKQTPSLERKFVKVKNTLEDYDSDSELSVKSDIKFSEAKRPSRSAAVTATKRLRQSVQAQDDDDDVDDEDDDSISESVADNATVHTESDNSNVSEDVTVKLTFKNKSKVTPQLKPKRSSVNSSVQAAIDKQREALEAGEEKQSKKKTGKAMKGRKKGEMTKKFVKKGEKRRKSEPGDDSSDDGSEESVGDPMAGINMNSLLKKAMTGSRFSPLHAFCWWRVVLDEAHFIKSRTSQTAASAFALTSVHRWCLSGTPLQNRVGELFSLIRFLRLDPMAYYFCRQKGCNCKSIHYRFENGRCLDCNHRPFSHFAHFNRHVLTPIQHEGYTGDGRRAMFTLKQEVLDKCLLRRTKETRAEDMNLPPRIVTIRSVRLHPVEEDFYQALYTQTKSSFDDYVAQGTLLNNYAHIFDLLTKMRQAVNHPYLIVFSKRNVEKLASQENLLVANGSVDCDMCHEPPTDRVLSSCCGAGFCRSCVLEYLTGAVGDNTPCPSCRAPFTIDLNQTGSDEAIDDAPLKLHGTAAIDRYGMPSLKDMPHVPTGSILRRINLAEFATSTKIEVLVQELVDMRKHRPSSKALVFSQFVNMLDLARWRIHSDPCLADLGLGVRILHGGMDVKSRDAVLHEFREDKNCRVLLMSLKAAGVALNLTVASECFLLDLWWNPAAEMQAIDRTHRLGQYRPIRAVRFVAEGTVEERVLQLQEKKRLVFDGTIGRDASSLKMLTVDDMVALFA